MDYAALFEPIDVGTATVKNRIVLPAHGPRLPPQRFLSYLEERVRGGIGLVIFSPPSIMLAGSYQPSLSLPTPDHYRGNVDYAFPNPSDPDGADALIELLIPALRTQAEMAHRYDTLCFAQLSHAGAYQTEGNWMLGIGPSGLPDELLGEATHAMSKAEIADLVRVFGWGATAVLDAGVDGIEVHACHGLLLNAFLSPLQNRRQDEYGGSLENRVRIVREVLEEVRRQVGADVPVGLRLGVEDHIDGGREDAVATVRLLEPLIDYVNISGASEGGRKAGPAVPTVASMDFPEAVYGGTAAAIHAAVDVPVLLTGRITRPETAARLITDGTADLVGMVRAHIADPAWAAKVREGNAASVRLCTGDNEGCRQRTLFRTRTDGFPIGCTVNAAAGREEQMAIKPATSSRHVLVVGGGPGGMEAARVAALRGHHVTLCERSDRLGGRVRTAVREPRTRPLGSSIEWLMGQLEELRVDVRLGTEVTATSFADFGADATVVATGANPSPHPAYELPNVVSSWDVLEGNATVTGSVCVVTGWDGYRGPLNLAELLAEDGRRVVLVTERMIVGESMDPGSNHHAITRLVKRGVELRNLTRLEEVGEGHVTVSHTLAGERSVISDIDTVVLAIPPQANDTLLTELRDTKTEVHGVGDCMAPRRVLHAIREGSIAGRLV